jgi:hypothetical protein
MTPSREVKAAATLAEQERIIKLLDEAFIYGTPVVIQREQLIALIKGEHPTTFEAHLEQSKGENK